MPAEARCECCDLPVAMCGRAAERRQAAEEANARSLLLAQRGWIAAAYPGTCAGCGTRYEVGSPIHHLPGGWGSDCCSEPPVHHGGDDL